MRQRTARRLVAPIALHAADPLFVVGTDNNLRAEGVALRGRIKRADGQPVALLADRIPQHAGLATDLRDDQIERTIAIDIVAGQVPPHAGCAAEGWSTRRDVAELASPVVGKQVIAFRVQAEM